MSAVDQHYDRQGNTWQSYGWQVEPSPYGPRGIIAKPEVSHAGNVILRVGNENENASWRLEPVGSRRAHLR